jgi:hypothetical protein
MKSEFDSLIESVSSIVVDREVQAALQDLKNSIDNSVADVEKHANVIKAASEGFSKLRSEQKVSEKIITRELDSLATSLINLKESQKIAIEEIYINLINAINQQNKYLKLHLGWITGIIAIILVVVSIIGYSILV